MKERLFRFKEFSVAHRRSAMKVGVDGVLVGAWGGRLPQGGEKRILDAGCGCGLIALMCAQMNESARITGVDIDVDSAEEAAENAAASKWSDRVEIIHADIAKYLTESRENFDLIISNPPFFESGVTAPDTARLTARHASDFGPEVLLSLAASRLRSGGRTVLIAPVGSKEQITDAGAAAGLQPCRIATVNGRAGGAPKRVMMEFAKTADRCGDCILEHIDIETKEGEYSPKYVNLTKNFYLKF